MIFEQNIGDFMIFVNFKYKNDGFFSTLEQFWGCLEKIEILLLLKMKKILKSWNQQDKGENTYKIWMLIFNITTKKIQSNSKTHEQKN